MSTDSKLQLTLIPFAMTLFTRFVSQQTSHRICTQSSPYIKALVPDSLISQTLEEADMHFHQSVGLMADMRLHVCDHRITCTNEQRSSN